MSVYLQEPHAKRRADEIVFSENQIYLHVRGFTAGQNTVENQDWATGPPGRGPLGRGPAFSKTPSEQLRPGPMSNHPQILALCNMEGIQL